MNTIGEREKRTQERVIEFFRDALDYDYLGNWQDRANNSNIDKKRLTDLLKTQGHDDNIINKTLYQLDRAAKIDGNRTLYDANREVYELLRYGVKVRPDVGEPHITVWLIDWKNPHNNDFAIAEEVTIIGEHTKRPDLVLVYQRHRNRRTGVETFHSFCIRQAFSRI